ncbi:uncharacterized protein LOC118411971 isoform X2 [Branchiostoma floridae]|uniref:Uncharacterized protein LOC118411971 isoform X2 n=1 Tax=Branchiostoma floridae TaxID=7739 RepID=A0A9J7KTV3_BRAFL|nr:uncharacterized protein LOC118411971 isoform X2 [Branchiostoma floridae]
MSPFQSYVAEVINRRELDRSSPTKMKAFYYTCLMLLPVVVFSAPAGGGYRQEIRDLEDMMAQFMHLDKPKPTIALAAAQTVKAEENYKKAAEARGLEDMMAQFMPNLDKPKPTIALAAAQTVKAEENYKKVIEDNDLTDALEKLETDVLLLKVRRMVEKLGELLQAKKRA